MASADATARAILDPNLRHALAAMSLSEPALGSAELGSAERGVGLPEHFRHLENLSENADTGDLSVSSRLLTAQAITLDNMFSEMARRAALNMGNTWMPASGIAG